MLPNQVEYNERAPQCLFSDEDDNGSCIQPVYAGDGRFGYHAGAEQGADVSGAAAWGGCITARFGEAFARQSYDGEGVAAAVGRKRLGAHRF